MSKNFSPVDQDDIQVNQSHIKRPLDCNRTVVTLYNYIQVTVEVLGIIFDEEEKSSAVAGDNVKLKLRGIEEEVCYYYFI